MFKKFLLVPRFLSILFFVLTVFAPAEAEEITPGQQQEYLDAKGALEAAKKVQAEKTAPETLKQAEDHLLTAENSRVFKDAVKFTQASRLARAYAELAKAIAELRIEEEKLAKVQEGLQKAKAEIDRLKKAQ